MPANSELELGIVCIEKDQPGRTVWQMRADERFANPAGALQGGFLSALCDTAMGSATVTWARAEGRKVFSANAEMKISFLRSARIGSVLTCTASVVSGGRRVVFVEAAIVDDDSRDVARASSTYVLTER
ncbi:MAG: PaaI family thioesterase [Acidimicrobiales bacterium]